MLRRFDVFWEYTGSIGWSYEIESRGAPMGWDLTVALGWFQMIISYTT